MRVALLGPTTVEADDGTPVDIGGARVRMLLARLALDPGRPVPTTTLIDDLWGEQPPADASNALQSLVSRLRKACPDVTLEPGGYRLAITQDDVDEVAFALPFSFDHEDYVQILTDIATKPGPELSWQPA